MEEIMTMIFNGINLVKELEFSLSSQEPPESDLSSSLGSISTLFGDANERLTILLAWRNSLPQQEPVRMMDMTMQTEPALTQDHWLRCPVMRTVEAIDTSRPRHQKRRIIGEEETVLVAAVGRMEIPPDDNYTWRKYGQKEILGSTFPRAYYRGTHQKLYKCPAKKQVQRLDEDPYTFRVTYRSSHTCHLTNFPISSAHATTTTANVPAIVNLTEAMIGNMDSVVPLLGEPYFNHHCLVPGDDGDGDTWNSPSQRYDMSSGPS
ncbi:PREDICTED: WRKY transcription factor 55-like [Camelina sativa]|uniref:WRKY transcription factor 55-like n=1 Tax=Camelina sativa TaxID=90675 RepID=A0ABM0ZIL2_CAMSA|nr:PREDICTED: WRKY transcription factor 55-like [Camelina sativa]